MDTDNKKHTFKLFSSALILPYTRKCVSLDIASIKSHDTKSNIERPSIGSNTAPKLRLNASEVLSE
jgi:hypothetical protein